MLILLDGITLGLLYKVFLVRSFYRHGEVFGGEILAWYLLENASAEREN